MLYACLFWTIWLFSNLWSRNLRLYTYAHIFLFPEYPLNPKSRSSRMLVIKKGSTKELQISGFPLVGSLHLQPVKNGTGTSVYKGLVPKPATPPAKVSFGYWWVAWITSWGRSGGSSNSECAHFTPENSVPRVCFQVLHTLSATCPKVDWKHLLIFLLKLYYNWNFLYFLFTFFWEVQEASKWEWKECF